LLWDGTLDLAQADAGEGIKLNARGRLAGDGMVLGMPGNGLDLQQGRLEWKGDVAVTGAADGLRIEAGGQIAGDDTCSRAGWNGREMLPSSVQKMSCG
jgi:hypothetical protein